MKTTILFLLLLSATSTTFALSSSFESQVPGVSVPNAHILLTGDKDQALVIRGMAPTANQIDELKSVGVEKVIIFKNETKDEVQKEIAELKEQGFKNRDILHIAFPWKDLIDFHDSCRMTVRALQFMDEAVASEKPVFFHCTVGEDRTGYLAGLFRLWQTPEISVGQVFKTEMCDRGYEAGSARKPKLVVGKIRETLTPTFLRMASLVQSWKRQGLSLDVSLCNGVEPALEKVKKIPVCR